MRMTLMKLAINFSLLEPANCFHLLVDFGGAAKHWSENAEKKNEKRSKALHFFFSFRFVLTLFKFNTLKSISISVNALYWGFVANWFKNNKRCLLRWSPTRERQMKKLEKSMQNRGRRTCTQVSLLNKTHITHKDKRKE